jgi:hypothetical protein
MVQCHEVGMTDETKKIGKLDVRIGKVKFKGEGDQEWLAQQLERVVQAAPDIPPDRGGDSDAEVEINAGDSSSNFSVSLASYIRSKGAEGNQVLRFLVTANWLRRRGTSALTASAIAKALADNHQSRLANAADCLNKNVSKGFCEKIKDGFFITPEGLKELGDQ